MPKTAIIRFFTPSGTPVDIQNIALDADDATAQEVLGTRIAFADGREYVYVEASTALVAGSPVQVTDRIAPLLNADIDAVAAIGDTEVVATGDFTNDNVVGAMIWFDDNTGAGQQRIITRRIDDDTVRFDEPLTVALDATTDYLVQRLYTVEPKATTAVTTPAVAQYIITLNQFGWVQTLGLGHGLLDVSADPLVAGELCVVGTAVAGTIEGLTAAATTVDDLASTVGVAWADSANAADLLVPISIAPNGRF